MTMSSLNEESTPGGRLSSPFATLRRFLQAPTVQERCELCSEGLAAEHAHLVEPATRRLLCACDACAILFDGQHNARYRRVPRRLQLLCNFQMTDVEWNGLLVPIGLAFFFHSTPLGRVIALFPSPAGATESELPPEAWQELVAANPLLGKLEPDVEALLVNRVGTVREYLRVPIDQCYKLVGLVRTKWHGLSGGPAVWVEIERFFTELKRRAEPVGEATHA